MDQAAILDFTLMMMAEILSNLQSTAFYVGLTVRSEDRLVHDTLIQNLFSLSMLMVELEHEARQCALSSQHLVLHITGQ